MEPYIKAEKITRPILLAAQKVFTRICYACCLQNDSETLKIYDGDNKNVTDSIKANVRIWLTNWNQSDIIIQASEIRGIVSGGKNINVPRADDLSAWFVNDKNPQESESHDCAAVNNMWTEQNPRTTMMNTNKRIIKYPNAILACAEYNSNTRDGALPLLIHKIHISN